MSLFRKQGRSPVESVLISNVIAAVVGLPFMFGQAPAAQGWLGLVLLGVFQLGLSYLLYTAAIKEVSALEATLFSTLEPILNPIWVWLLIGERPGGWALAGGALVLGAIVARSVLGAVRPTRRPAAAGTTP